MTNKLGKVIYLSSLFLLVVAGILMDAGGVAPLFCIGMVIVGFVIISLLFIWTERY